MSAAKHTPGPWRCVDGRVFSNTYVLKGAPVATVHKRHRPGQYEGNASVIAAAPELLEALKAADLAMSNKHFAAEVLAPDSVVREMMRAAIAKAEGGAE